MRGEDIVDKRFGGAEIILGIEEAVEVLRGKMRSDLRVGGKNVAEIFSL